VRRPPAAVTLEVVLLLIIWPTQFIYQGTNQTCFLYSPFFLSFSPVENNKKKILRCVYVCKVQEYIGTQTHLETLENGCA
jgi:hypothetical protein